MIDGASSELLTKIGGDKQKIEEAKSNLSNLRTESIEKSVEYELALMGMVGNWLDSIPYEKGHGTIEDIMETGKANCEGKTTIASMVLEEMGIEHVVVVGSTQGLVKDDTHVFLMGVTSDDKIWKIDYTQAQENQVTEIVDGKWLDQVGDELKSVEVAEIIRAKRADRTVLKTNDESLKKAAGTELLSYIPDLTIEAEIFNPEIGRSNIRIRRLASNFSKAGDVEGAIAIMEGVPLSQQSDIMLRNLAVGYWKVGKSEEEIGIRNKIVERHPDSVVDRIRLADACENAGGFQSALVVYDEGKQKFGDNPSWVSSFSGALARDGQIDQAIQVTGELLESDKYDPKIVIQNQIDLVELHLLKGVKPNEQFVARIDETIEGSRNKKQVERWNKIKSKIK